MGDTNRKRHGATRRVTSARLDCAANTLFLPVCLFWSSFQFRVQNLIYSEMKVSSTDLRERMVAACGEPGARIYQMFARFRVSVAFVDKLLRRQRTTGSVAALPACSDPAPRLNPAGRAQLLVCLGQCPAAALDEVWAALAATGRPVLSCTAGWRAMESMGWGCKKSVHAVERDTERVGDYAAHLWRSCKRKI